MGRLGVVGGGISGLAAAHQLLLNGAGEVVLLEASDELGGKIAATTHAGRLVDTGPDGFLSRREETFTLIAELGLGGQLRDVGAAGASVLARGELRDLPAGLAMGIPTDVRALRRSGTVSTYGWLRAWSDRWRPARARDVDDLDVGELVRSRLGGEVARTLVDPMVGGIHAGRIDGLSAQAAFPQLVDAARRGGSLMAALAPSPAAAAPPGAAGLGRAGIFASLDGSLASLPEVLARSLRERGAELRTGTPVVQISRSGGRWELGLDGGTLELEGLVLATSAGTAAALLGAHAPAAAEVLSAITYASVGVVTVAYPADALRLPETGTGILVPNPSSYPGIDGPLLTTAVTFLSRKWPHLAVEGEVLVRASVGKVDDLRFAGLNDDALAARVVGELDVLLHASAAPAVVDVTRWMDALPQYEVHHHARIAQVEAQVAALGGIALAGAAYHGVGIPACIASGRAAANLLNARS